MNCKWHTTRRRHPRLPFLSVPFSTCQACHATSRLGAFWLSSQCPDKFGWWPVDGTFHRAWQLGTKTDAGTKDVLVELARMSDGKWMWSLTPLAYFKTDRFGSGLAPTVEQAMEDAERTLKS
jgi:hypothetical protein